MKVPVKVKAGCRQRKRIKKDIQEAVCNGILQANAQMNSSGSEEKKIGFWRTIWCIIKGKGSDGSRYTTAIFTSLLGTFFNTLAFLGLMVFIVIICSTVNQIRTWSWNCESIWGNVIQLISTVVFLILVFLFALMFRGGIQRYEAGKGQKLHYCAVFRCGQFCGADCCACCIGKGVMICKET